MINIGLGELSTADGMLTGIDAMKYLAKKENLTFVQGVDPDYSDRFGFQGGEDRILLGRDGNVVATMDQLTAAGGIKDIVIKALAK